MSSIVITGGAGFVGSHAAKVAAEAGHQVTVLDSLELGHRAAVPPAAKLIEVDLLDIAALTAALEASRPEIVMHFSAYSQVGESVQDPVKYYRNNVGGTANLLAVANALSIGSFIFSSTAATYGIPEGVLDETHPTNPINPYGFSKLCAERMLRDNAFSTGMRVISFRYFNVAGAAPDGSIGEDHSPETHLIPRAINAALGRGQPLQIFGDDYNTPDGTCIRDYIHAQDLARAHLIGAEKLAAVTPNHGRGYFDLMNIGTGSGHSVMEVVSAVREVTGLDVPFSVTERRPGDPPTLVANADKIQRELSWRPEFPDIRDSVRHAFGWMRGHPNGFGDGAK